jgi:hypothetical protein
MRITYEDTFLFFGLIFLTYAIGTGKFWDAIVYLGHMF